MGCWSPLDAMEAYMHTVQLCKDYYNEESTVSSSKLIKPKCVEFISALAAGNQARLMVDVQSGGISPLTLALAVAARQTAGCVICIRQEQEALNEARSQIESFHLGDVVHFKLGKPSEVIKHLKSIDFAVVDHRIRDRMELFLVIDMNPCGSVLVVSNLHHGRSIGASYGQLVRGRGGIESVVLPIGGGMEVTRIRMGGREEGGRHNVGGRFKRTFLVY